MADTYFTRTPGSAGNRRTFTWSAWLKRSGFGSTNRMWSAGTSIPTNNNDLSSFIFNSDDTMTFFGENGGVQSFQVKTSQVFRDTSAWYHIVLAVDTTQATASNRVKFYVNGSQVTDFSTASYMSQNYDTFFNATNLHVIGYSATAATFNGYMAHVNFTDGTAYAASDFGQTDTNGQWKPITAPSVTYGTNGYFLKFANSGSLGTDSSGNGNNFTQSGSGDQVTDTPDNVFCTANSLMKSTSDVVLSNGNLKVVSNYASGWQHAGSTFAVTSGKWYWEAKATVVAASDKTNIAVVQFNTDEVNFVGNTNKGLPSTCMISGHGAGVGSYTYVQGDIIMCAMDITNNTVYWGKNGTWYGTLDPAAGTGSVKQTVDNSNYCMPLVGGYGGSTWELNFGHPQFSITSGNTDGNGYGNFEYAPPTGYLALCTKNLASELTLPIGDGSLYQNQVLYTGDGNNSRTVTGTGFQPDWVWVKVRNTGYGHKIFDSSRGQGKRLASDTANAEATVTDELTSFDSDGFTTNNNAGMNENTRPYVAWQWKANGGTTSTNTDGTVSCTIQTNSTSKFSIFTYSGTSSVSSTVGHGLGTTPAMIIVKNITDTGPWWTVWHQDAGETSSNLPLNSDTAPWTPGGGGYITSVGSSTWGCSDFVSAGGVGDNIMSSGKNYIGYAFAEVEGYSKFGSYTGNGSTDGPFVYTGFRPALVITKCASTTGNWALHDNKRLGYNPDNNLLYPNLTNTEGTPDLIDIVSNGFKITKTNAVINSSGASFIYIAFAKHPFVDSTGRPVTAR